MQQENLSGRSTRNSSVSYLMPLNIIVVGRYHVGKSCLVQRYYQDQFNDKTIKNTIGVDFKFKKIQLSNQINVILNIWDTAGSERYNALCKNYLQKAQGVLLVFDLTNPESFREIQQKWYDKVQNECSDDPVILLIGTKGDLIDKVNEEYQRYPEVVNPKQSFSQKLNQKQCVKKKDIIEFCKKYKIKYFKASSKSNENVHDLFQYISEMTFRRFKDQMDIFQQNNISFSQQQQQESNRKNSNNNIEQQSNDVNLNNNHKFKKKDCQWYDNQYFKFYSNGNNKLDQYRDSNTSNIKYYCQSNFESTKTSMQSNTSRFNSSNRESVRITAQLLNGGGDGNQYIDGEQQGNNKQIRLTKDQKNRKKRCC